MALHRRRPLYSYTEPKRPPEPAWKKALGVLWAALKRTCMVIGAVVLLSALISAIISARIAGEIAPDLPDEMVLVMDLEDGFDEVPPLPGLAEPLAPAHPTLRQTIDAIDAAAADPRVLGILARMRGGSFSIAHTQEIRAAIKRFRESGKFAHIYSSSYGEGMGGLGRYYLASAFDEIWMQPMGVVSIPGIAAEMPYFRGLLDKIGVQPEFYQRKEYKSAYENLERTEPSPAAKEMMGVLLDDFASEIVRDIAADGRVSGQRFEALVDKGLLLADEAVKEGLITRADYADNLLSEVKEKITGNPEDEDLPFVSLESYGAVTERKAHHRSAKAGGRNKVALIYAAGPIMEDSAGGRSAVVAAASEIAPSIMDATDDRNVRAIVLRIDSPGGSPVASETILRALQQAKKKGKMVIVSMGPAAASGGYWIAAAADRIFTMPGTMTGSIGVLGGKFTVQDMSNKLGVTWDRSLSWGRNAGMWSPVTPFSESEAERVNAMLDNVYDAFVTRVAEGRGMERADVEKIAKGRVWSGMRAVEIGLADELGGLNAALDFAAQSAGLKSRKDIRVEVLPRPQTPLERLMNLLGAQVSMGSMLGDISSVLEGLQPLGEEIRMIRKPADYMVYEKLRVE